MLYFPDKFYKFTPPKKYFWQVFSQVFTERYMKMIEGAKFNLRRYAVITREKKKITQESLNVYQSFLEDKLFLLSFDY
jgi:hypothetical protein